MGTKEKEESEMKDRTRFLCEDDDGLVSFSDTYDRDKVTWRKTSHKWARRNPEEVMWLSPICTKCNPEWEVCRGHNPFQNCDYCDRQATPYRSMP